MINIRAEGDYFKIGLNLCFARNHVAVHWVWFDFERHEGSYRGFTVSRKGFKVRRANWDVVKDYMRIRNLEMVHKEVLQDLVDAERHEMRQRDEWAYVNRLDSRERL